jgi:hypothetical protein
MNDFCGVAGESKMSKKNCTDAAKKSFFSFIKSSFFSVSPKVDE